jgi:nicotinate-nucleotide pyrophosphorylase (carboxylating)
MEHLEREVRRTILLAFNEDRIHQDITSEACISDAKIARANFVLKQNAKVAGLRFLQWIYESFDPNLKCTLHVEEGAECAPGTILASIEGNARLILATERTALNLIQHASGIASLTAQYVKAVESLNCQILDTRKTLPGLRAIQKYAVVVGGGKNHRLHLEDRFLIKNNHLKLLRETLAHPVKEAIDRARKLHPSIPLEVEVENLSDFKEALDAKAEVIMLDNMPVPIVAEAVALAQGKAYLEASGGINLSNVREYAMTGVNGISIGSLTHSINAVDISLRL